MTALAVCGAVVLGAGTASANQSSHCVELEAEGKPAGECWAEVAKEIQLEEEERERIAEEENARREAEFAQRERKELEAIEQEQAVQDEIEARREARARSHEAKLRREWAHKPTVTRSIAEGITRKALREETWGWSGRNFGQIECRGGRVNRISFICGAQWLRGDICRKARIRVWGIGYQNGIAWFKYAGGWNQGYGFVENGHLYCFI